MAKSSEGGNVLNLTDRLRGVADGDDSGQPRLSKQERKQQRRDERRRQRPEVDEFASDAEDGDEPPIATAAEPVIEEDDAEAEPPQAEIAPAVEAPLPAPPEGFSVPKPPRRRGERMAGKTVVTQPNESDVVKEPEAKPAAKPAAPRLVAVPVPDEKPKKVKAKVEPTGPRLSVRAYHALRALGLKRVMEVVALVLFPVVGSFAYYFDFVDQLAYGMTGLVYMIVVAQIYYRFESLLSIPDAIRFGLGLSVFGLLALSLLLANETVWRTVATAVVICFASDLLIVRRKG